MFHFFDKVYLEFDAKISAEVRRIVISETCGSPDGREPEGTRQNPLHCGRQITDLIGEGKTFSSELDFFKQLKVIGDSATSPLVVYCDKNSFLHLFIAWHKFILDNISADTLWKIFKFLIEKETYFSNFLDNPTNLTFSQFNISQWDKTIFDNKFNSLSIAQDRLWNSTVIPNLGIELLLLGYIVAPTNTIKSSLKSKIILLTSRSLLSELFEAKFELILNYQNKKLHNVLGVTNLSTLQELFSQPRLEIFTDPTIWNEAAVLYPTASGSSLNISAVTSSQVTKLIDAYNLVRVEFNGISPTTPQVDIINRLPWAVAGTLSDQQLTELLNNLEFSGSSVSESTDREKVNTMFVDWILRLHRSSSTTEISNLRIAT
jgi:hypothetical protein